MDEKGTFKEYYLFQYNNLELAKLVNAKEIMLVQANKTLIKINCDNRIIAFTINNSYKEKDEEIQNGYGLSKRTGNFSINNQISNPTSILDYILHNNIQNRAAMTCHSGGPGATECSITPSNVNLGATESTVACGAGYFACCDDTKGECRCAVNTPDKVKSIH